MATMGDVVLVHVEDRPAFFARIEDICADRKRDWYQVRLLLLQVPMAELIMILREEYINGETFTMEGRNMRIEKVVGMSEAQRAGTQSIEDGGKDNCSSSDKVVPIFDRKRP